MEDWDNKKILWGESILPYVNNIAITLKNRPVQESYHRFVTVKEPVDIHFYNCILKKKKIGQ